MPRRRAITLVLIAAASSWSFAGDLTVHLPDGQSVIVDDARPATLSLKDGTRLIGVDMRWYAPPGKQGDPLMEEDRAAIAEILTVPSFYDTVRMLALEGNSQQAIALVELIRQRDFHAGKGQIIWRVELWYFQFLNGGWAKVAQQNKLLDRQRFADRQSYEMYTASVRYVPKLGLAGPSPATSHAELTLTKSDLLPVGTPP